MAGFHYPLLLEPVPVPKVWAGGKLGQIPGRQSNTQEPIGESWDVSTWPTAPDNPELVTVTRIKNGPLTGRPLDQVANVPVVVKVIDSGDKLSVQSHPNRPDAHKNEMWYILAADPGAYLYMGFADGVTPQQFCQLINQQPPDEERILGALNRYQDVPPGMNFTIPAPTVHALGPGLLTFEISERSQVTYRLYDYDRPRSRGKLDLSEGCHALLEALADMPVFGLDVDIHGAADIVLLSAFPTFSVLKVTGDKLTVTSAGQQHLVTACKGPLSISGPTPDWSIELPYSFTCLVPPTEHPYTIDSHGSGEVLISPLVD